MYHESYAVVKVCTSQPAAYLLDKMTRPTTLRGPLNTPLPPCLRLSCLPLVSPFPHSHTVLTGITHPRPGCCPSSETWFPAPRPPPPRCSWTLHSAGWGQPPSASPHLHHDPGRHPPEAAGQLPPNAQRPLRFLAWGARNKSQTSAGRVPGRAWGSLGGVRAQHVHPVQPRRAS